MPVRTPEDWPGTFEKAFNQEDLEQVMELYEPEARFVQAIGGMLEGRDGVRAVLRSLMEKHTKFEGHVLKTVVAGDIAMLYTDWRLTGDGVSTGADELRQRAVEILRRQEDGSWRLLVGDPGGRG